METKRCSRCNKVKPLEEFHKCRDHADGHSYYCKACQAAYRKEYREEHREEIAAQQKEYREEHRDERAAYYKEYYEEHRDERAAYDKEHEQTAKGREVRRKAGSTRRALKLGATVGDVNEAAIYERDKVCVYCGAAEGLTIDHVVALANGGAHAQDNLVVACGRCNSRKGTMNAEAFVRQLVLRASP